jgi:hypothetical protein
VSRPKKNDPALLEALACGLSAAAVARQVGVNERTIFRRLKDPAFCQQLQAKKTEMRQRNADLLNASSTAAMKTLLRLLNESQPPTVQLGAARAILEYALRLDDSVDFDRRLSALEQLSALKQAA